MNALKYFNYDGVLPCMDLTVEAEALGARVTYQENAFPFIQEHPIRTPMQIFELKPPSIEDSRLSVFIETTKLLSDSVGNSHFVSSYVIGPFTLVGHLIGVEKILELTIEDPELAVDIIKHCTSLIKPYIENLVKAGAHNIVILEPTASTSIISPNFFRKFSFPFLEQLTSFIHSLDCKATIHICGETRKIIDSMCATGVDALSLDSAIDFADAKKVTSERTTLVGNIDTSLMLTGSVNQVADSSQRCIEGASNKGGFILSTGCDIPIETPIENIQTLVNTAKDYVQ
jgi:uroporphyrinogen decarboxylase